MDNDAKKKLSLISVSIIILFVISLCGAYTYMKYGGEIEDTMLVENSDEVTALAHEMIDYELPAGYYESVGQKQGSTNIVVIKREDSDISEMVLVEYLQNETFEQFNKGELTIEQLADEMHDEQRYSMKLTEQYEIEIAAELVHMYLYSGVDEDGVEINQLYSGLFSGKRYPMVLIITGSMKDWNPAEIEAFLKSIQ